MKGYLNAACAAAILCASTLAGCATDHVAPPSREQIDTALNIASISLQTAEGVYAVRRPNLPAEKVAKLDQIFKDADAALAAAQAAAQLTDGSSTVSERAGAIGKLVGQGLDLLEEPPAP